MKRFFVLTLLLCALHIAFIPLSAQEICGTDALLEQRLQELGLTYEQYFDQMSQSLGNLSDVERSLQDNRVYIIPTVIHILHFGEEVGSGYNVSNETIYSQMVVLNESFAETHIDAENIPEAFQAEKAGDTKIRFVLANRDPRDNPSNGITRTRVPRSGTVYLNASLLRLKAAWNNTQYYNIWVLPGSKLEGGVIGVALGPAPERFSLPDADGTLIITESLPGGRANHDQGKTLPHEAGHYLGLLHPWGRQGPGCRSDDGCLDTPSQEKAYYTRHCFQARYSCGHRIMVENYMTYSADICQIMFTKCQRTRMRRIIGAHRYRSLLWQNAEDRTPVLHTSAMISNTEVRMYPNPVAGTLYFSGLSTTHHYQYKIYTATGLLMHSGVLRKNNIIDTRILHRGQYIVSLHTQVGAEAIRSALIVR